MLFEKNYKLLQNTLYTDSVPSRKPTARQRKYGLRSGDTGILLLFSPAPTASRNYIIISTVFILIHHFGRFFIKKVFRRCDGILHHLLAGARDADRAYRGESAYRKDHGCGMLFSFAFSKNHDFSFPFCFLYLFTRE